MGRYTIFLDTNSIISNAYKIDSSPIINHFIKSGLLEVVLSQVVVDEVVKNNQKDRDNILSELEKIRREGKRCGFKIPRLFPHDDFQESFKTKLHELKVKIIDIIEADINTIYKKAFSLQKPFKSKNEKESGGIKDAIIWSSTLSYLSKKATYEQIIFVTDDGDFVNKTTGKLHDDISKDLESIGKSIITVRNIHELIKLLAESASSYNELQQKIADEILSTYRYKCFSINEELKKIEYETTSNINSIIEDYVYNELEALELDEINIIPGGNINLIYDLKFLEEDLAYIFFNETYKATYTYAVSLKYYDSDIHKGMVVDGFDIEGLMYNVVEETVEISFDFECAIDCRTGDVLEFNRFSDGKILGK